MNKFIAIFFSFFLICTSGNSHAFFDQLFQQCETLLLERNWHELACAKNKLEKKIEAIKEEYQTPYWKRFNRLGLKELLQKRKFRHAYEFIYDAASHYYQRLDNNNWSNLHSEEDFALLHHTLKNPTENLRPFAARHATDIHNLILALTEYDLYMDNLVDAYALCEVILHHAQNDNLSPQIRFYIKDPELLVRAHLLMGQIAFYGSNLESSQNHFETVITHLNNQDAAEKGYALLGLASIACTQGDAIKTQYYATLASQILEDDLIGKIYVKLIKAQASSLHIETKEQALAELAEAEANFFGAEDPFGRGLAALALYKLSQKEKHYRLAADIGQKKTLPLLVRLISGQQYAPTPPFQLDQDVLDNTHPENTKEELCFRSYPLEPIDEENTEAPSREEVKQLQQEFRNKMGLEKPTEASERSEVFGSNESSKDSSSEAEDDEEKPWQATQIVSLGSPLLFASPIELLTSSPLL